MKEEAEAAYRAETEALKREEVSSPHLSSAAAVHGVCCADRTSPLLFRAPRTWVSDARAALLMERPIADGALCGMRC
eukprot:764077-Rhodomonas_salina.1